MFSNFYCTDWPGSKLKKFIPTSSLFQGQPEATSSQAEAFDCYFPFLYQVISHFLRDPLSSHPITYKVCGDMSNLFSGTPWLLDVLNGFIAHNNVSLFQFNLTVNYSHFSTISSSSSLTWSTRSTASSSSSCSSQKRTCWRVFSGCGDGGGRRTEWRQCSRRPAMLLSPSQAP